MDPLAIIDISRTLAESTEVYPGDEPFSRAFICNTAKGDASNVTAVRGTSHAATHADLPCHLFDGAPDPPLGAFVGEAVVVEQGDPLPIAPRLLFKGLGSLEADTVEHVIETGAVLVGIEGMSVDQLNSTDLPNHHKLLGAGIVILENLDLSGVPAGVYELIALPLKIPNADATWVRAVLRTP